MYDQSDVGENILRHKFEVEKRTLLRRIARQLLTVSNNVEDSQL